MDPLHLSSLAKCGTFHRFSFTLLLLKKNCFSMFFVLGDPSNDGSLISIECWQVYKNCVLSDLSLSDIFLDHWTFVQTRCTRGIRETYA